MQITGPGGAQWRSAMLEAPVFLASTPQNFYGFLKAASSKDANAVPQFLEAHPEMKVFLGWAKTHPRTESWTEDRFNSLNSFVFTDTKGAKHTVRWSILPENAPVTLSEDELKTKSPDFLEDDIVKRVASGPQRWKLVVTVADPGDPTADPTQAWPTSRRTVTVGELAITQIEQEADGPCREINFDPTVLPAGIATSDDPFPAARSAAYRVSYDRRTAEESSYPHTAKGGQ
jgi:catalase